jgi:glycerophosphoryl diester phosphodiesterase
VHPLLDLSARPVVAHRGNRAHAPENTLEAFRQGVVAGADAIEFDVRATRDGEVVVMHDPTLERTTDGTGEVAALPLAAVRSCNAGARFSRDGGQTHPYHALQLTVPTLDEVLRAFPSLPLLIEIKTLAASAGTRALIDRHGARDRCVVASFESGALAPFEGSRIPRCSTPSETAALYLPALLGRRCRALSFQAMSLPRVHKGIPLPLAAIARTAATAGVPLHVWTVNDPAVARRLWRRGICGIISDDPARMVRERRDLPARPND